MKGKIKDIGALYRHKYFVRYEGLTEEDRRHLDRIWNDLPYTMQEIIVRRMGKEAYLLENSNG